MHSSEENALIVNAIQRASMVIVQNSLREGFGLTATEAMFKRVCFIGTHQACGLRTQVRVAGAGCRTGLCPCRFSGPVGHGITRCSGYSRLLRVRADVEGV